MYNNVSKAKILCDFYFERKSYLCSSQYLSLLAHAYFQKAIRFKYIKLYIDTFELTIRIP